MSFKRVCALILATVMVVGSVQWPVNVYAEEIVQHLEVDTNDSVSDIAAEEKNVELTTDGVDSTSQAETVVVEESEQATDVESVVVPEQTLDAGTVEEPERSADVESAEDISDSMENSISDKRETDAVDEDVINENDEVSTLGEATYELTYKVNDDGISATITGYMGTASGDLVIPETINEYTVAYSA